MADLFGISEDELARLGPADLCYFFGGLTDAAWNQIARQNQLPPAGEAWLVFYFQAGRGSGKTRAAAEWIARNALLFPSTRWAVVAPTHKDVIQVCFNGESGLLNIIPPQLVARASEKDAVIELVNGSKISGYTAEKPGRLRGPQHHGAWIDEPGSMDQGDEVWFQLKAGLRLPMPDKSPPRIFISGTPALTPFIETLNLLCEQEPERYVLTTGGTMDNAENLAEGFVEEMLAKYGNSALGQQELYGKLVMEAEGALVARNEIESNRVRPDEVPTLESIVIGVDPALSTKKDADMTGIIVGGIAERHVYILRDASIKAKAKDWGALLIELYHEYGASAIVCERNLAWPLLRDTFDSLDEADTVKIKPVTARGTKQERAQPIAAMYQNGVIHHVGVHPKLEDQWCTHVFHKAKNSPDRIDACVHTITHLRLGKRPMKLGMDLSKFKLPDRF